MPTYQYACTVCAERLEAVQKFTDEALTECPACGGALRKVFSAVGVVFKGSGFYKTDSRGSSASSKPAEPAASPSSDGAKPAAATTTPAPSSTGSTASGTAAAS